MRKRLTIEFIRQFLLENNCELLSDRYINNKVKLSYKASCGHITECTFSHIRSYNRFLCVDCKEKQVYNKVKVDKVKVDKVKVDKVKVDKVKVDKVKVDKVKVDKVKDKREFKTVAKKLERLIQKNMKYRNDFLPENYDKTLVCRDCKMEKRIMCFPYRPQCENNKEKRCKLCNSASETKRVENLNQEKYIKHLLTVCNKSIVRKARKGRNLEFNITPEDIHELIEKQNNKCIFTEREFEWDYGKSTMHNKPSIDRIDSDKGSSSSISLRFLNIVFR